MQIIRKKNPYISSTLTGFIKKYSFYDLMPFTFYKQSNAMDCGPTCLRMIAKHYGKYYNSDTLRQKTGFNKQGVSLLGISEAAEKIGLRTRGVQINFEKLMNAPVPAILHWNQNHFVVLIKINQKKIKVADPANGIMTYNTSEFLTHWISNHDMIKGNLGTALLLEPTPEFYETSIAKKQKLSWGFVVKYLQHHNWQLGQIILSLIISFIIQLIIPFLTQSMVDTGVNTRNMQYITIVLFAQLMLTFSNTFVSYIRSRLQLRISNSVNISILSDFWIKMTRLPLAYFDAHHTGDTIQRIGDNKKIQSFLTGQSITTLFSLLSFVAYSIILIFYSASLFMVFALGYVLYFAWITLFLKIRRKINYEYFYLASKENNSTLQLIQGMQEIRLNNAERSKRWEWENIQAGLFKLDFKKLNYDQWQSTGALFITQGKDILITFLVAGLVIEGRLTFGAMLAIQYIIGQLNGPMEQFIGLTQNFQDAKISMERLNEIHQMDAEEPAEKSFQYTLPQNESILINDLSFTYPGAGNDAVLKKVSLKIPKGKITAIVGTSGSGKTTLIKLLLKIYEDYEGKVSIGETNFDFISPSFWRTQCGAVSQEGFIFNDTIANNIAISDEQYDLEKIWQSCRIANITEFIDSLPNGINTQLGSQGVGLSQGQKQRLLIARAIYKDPRYLFFDEATNALDANNERAIVENLQHFFEGRTVVIVAHRLSTVRNADNIIVLDNGCIVENGSHLELTELKGAYYKLVKNQLELGS